MWREREAKAAMPHTVLEMQGRLLKEMSPERKLLASDALRRTAWQLKAAWIARQHPELDSQAVDARVRRAFLDAGT